jgi:serine/threonine protein kinase
MATGHPPFRAEQAMAILNRICHDRHRNVQEINPAIPDDLADAIDRLLEKKPGRRFATAEELRQTLERALAALQIPSRMSVRQWYRKFKRRPQRAAVAAGLVLVLIGGGWLLGKLARGTGADANLEAPMVQASPASDVNIETLRAEEREFASQFAVVRRSLMQLERNPFPDLRAVGNANNVWRGDLKSLDAELIRLERNWSSSGGIRNFGTSIGETR